MRCFSFFSFTFFFLFCLVVSFKTSAQTRSKDFVIRSGFTFNGYSDEISYNLSSSSNVDNFNTIRSKLSSFYFTPGFGKYLGKGYYLGVQGVFGKSKLDAELFDQNQELTNSVNTQSDRIGGGILFRKYFSLNDRLSPFVGINSNYFLEKGKAVSLTSNESFSVETKYFMTDIQVGFNFLIVPRLEIEGYYSPGIFYYRKNRNYIGKYEFESDFGKKGQGFSIGINYHLVRIK